MEQNYYVIKEKSTVVWYFFNVDGDTFSDLSRWCSTLPKIIIIIINPEDPLHFAFWFSSDQMKKYAPSLCMKVEV